MMARRAATSMFTSLLTICIAASQVPGRGPAGDPNPPDRVDFGTGTTLVPLRQTRVITFRLAQPAEADRSPEATVDDPEILRIVRAAGVLKGLDFGTVRVEGLRSGRTTLRVGGQSMQVEVVDRPSPWGRLESRPEIIAPVNGSVVWGGVGVGVEWFDDPLNPLTDVRVRINGGKELEPISVSGPEEGPIRRAAFTLAPGDTSSGPVELVATLRDRSGREVRSRSTYVRAVDPGENLAIYEAEDWATAAKPERFSRGRVVVQKDPAASGGAFVNNASADPAVGVVLEIKEPTTFQVMIVASGDAGGTALPTVGVVLDGRNEAATHGRLSTTRWHRVAVGTPVRVEPGFRVISTRFENDFGAR
ncbi:MAG: hypothetical protein JNJ48_07775, partial [Phycisphaerae bacterium]|nr:hypothetical protein [Phycisphaerae bacterium]